MTGCENEAEPVTPAVVKTPNPQDGKEAVPVDRVKSFSKVKLEDNRGGFFEVAAPDEVGSIDNVFRDSTAREETSLVSIHKRVDGRLEASSKHFGDRLHDAVLERYGPKKRGVVCGIRFREKDKEGPVDP
jgi:hypothetical protein